MQNIEECTSSKSILSALGPIAKKILELKHTRAGAICEANIILHLIKHCESFEIACNHLKDFLVIEANSLEDKTWISEIDELHQFIISSVKDFSDSTRDLHRGDVNVKSNDEVWATLIQHSEVILEELIKLMLSWDRAHLRQINKTAEKFLSTIYTIQDATFSYVTTNFQDIIEKVIELFKLIEKRCLDICRKSQREMIYVSSFQLHKLLNILAPIATDSCRNRSCKETKAARDFVIVKIDDTVQVLKKEIGLGSKTYDLQESGQYIDTLNSLFDAFRYENGNRAIEKLPILDSVKSPLEIVLQHCICVAQCFPARDRSLIMASCEDVLYQLKFLSKIEAQEYPNPSDVDVLFDVISDVLEKLEIEVNSALIKLIVNTFTEPFLILDSLIMRVKRINSSKPSTSNQVVPKSSSEAENVQELIKTFEDEVDKFYQIGGFVIACISDSKKIRLMETNLAMLNWLEIGLVASMVKIAQSEDDQKPPHSLAQLSLMCREWMKEVVALRNTIYSLMEIEALIYVTKQEVYKIWVEITTKLNGKVPLDSVWVKKRARRLSSLIQRLLSTNQHSNFFTEANVKELNIAIAEFNKSQKRAYDSTTLDSSTRSLLRRIQCLLTTLSRICSSSDGQDENFHSKYFQENLYFSPFDINEEKNEMAKLTEEEFPNGIGRISHLSDIPMDTSNSKIADASQRSLPFKPEMKISKRNRSSFQSVFKDNSIKPRQKSNNVTLVSNPLIDESGVNVNNAECPRNISIDITKFLLSRSSNFFRNSTRASKRNFSLKVKEISLDIGEVVKITPKLEAPRYVSPMCNYLEETSYDGFTDIIRKMEIFANSDSRGTSSGMSEATFAGNEKKKEFRKNDLFYHTFHPNLPVVNKNEEGKNGTKAPENSNVQSSKISINGVELSNFEKENTSSIKIFKGNENLPTRKQNSSIDHKAALTGNVFPPTPRQLTSPVGKRTTINKASVSSPIDWSIDISDNASGVDSMETPSSLNISTPQRIEDINSIQQKILALDINNKSP